MKITAAYTEFTDDCGHTISKAMIENLQIGSMRNYKGQSTCPLN